MKKSYVSAIILLENDRAVTGWLDCEIAQEAMEDNNRLTGHNFELVIDEKFGLAGDELLAVKDIWVGYSSPNRVPLN